MTKIDKEGMNISTILKDIACGWASGVAQVLTMMPFQNVATKMIQKPNEYPTVSKTIKKTITEQGIFSFYKGTLFPLVGVGAQVSLQFGFVESLKKVMKKNFADENGQLGSQYVVLSGFLSGIPSAIVVTPLDHARFRVVLSQVKNGPGSIKTAINISKHYGIKKLFLGLNVTLLRQMIGLALYFGTYDKLLPVFKDFGIASNIASFYVGGIAGLSTWSVVYPIHYVKVKIQTDSLTQPKFKSATQCAIQLYKANDIKKMYRGVSVMLMRAFVINGAGFVAFQNCKKFLYSQH